VDLTGLSLVIASTVAAVTSLAVAIGKAWRASVERAATERQVRATLEAKNVELDELKAENAKLWTLLEGLTS
jgi:hypothetical protein